MTARAKAFLQAYGLTASVVKAAEAANVSRTQHYRWIEDPEYAKAFELATKVADDTIEAEAVRRAVEGYWEPHIYHGQVSYERERDAEGNWVETDKPLLIRKFCPALHARLMSKNPKYAQNAMKVEHSGSIDLVQRLNAGRDRLAKLKAERGEVPTESV